MTQRNKSPDDDQIGEARSWIKVNLRGIQRVLETPLPSRPQLLLGSIRAAATTDMPDGESRVAESHRHQYDHHCSPHVSRLTEHRSVLSDLVSSMDRGLQSIARRLSRTDYYMPVPAEKVPWTPIDRVKVVFYGLLFIGSLAVAVNQLRIILLASGYFTSNWDATLFSLLPIGIAAVLEAFTDNCLCSDTGKRRYRWVIFGGALISGGFWILLFVPHFGDGLTMSSDFDTTIGVDFDTSLDTIPSDSSPDSSAGTGFLWAAMFGEILVAAAMWLAIVTLFSHHAPCRLVEKWEVRRLTRLASKFTKKRLEAADLLGRVCDHLRTIETGRHLHVSAALEQFHIARSKLLNRYFLSEEFRKLQENEDSSRAAAEANSSDTSAQTAA